MTRRTEVTKQGGGKVKEKIGAKERRRKIGIKLKKRIPTGGGRNGRQKG